MAKTFVTEAVTTHEPSKAAEIKQAPASVKTKTMLGKMSLTWEPPWEHVMKDLNMGQRK